MGEVGGEVEDVRLEDAADDFTDDEGQRVVASHVEFARGGVVVEAEVDDIARVSPIKTNNFFMKSLLLRCFDSRKTCTLNDRFCRLIL